MLARILVLILNLSIGSLIIVAVTSMTIATENVPHLLPLIVFVSGLILLVVGVSGVWRMMKRNQDSDKSPML